MQKLIVNNDLQAFDEEVNELMNKGWNIVPGTQYSQQLFGEKLLYSIVLWKNTQIMITGEDLTDWMGEAKSYFDMGFFVVPGTTYMTDYESPFDEVGETIHTVVMNKE